MDRNNCTRAFKSWFLPEVFSLAGCFCSARNAFLFLWKQPESGGKSSTLNIMVSRFWYGLLKCYFILHGSGIESQIGLSIGRLRKHQHRTSSSAVVCLPRHHVSRLLFVLKITSTPICNNFQQIIRYQASYWINKFERKKPLGKFSTDAHLSRESFDSSLAWTSSSSLSLNIHQVSAIR